MADHLGPVEDLFERIEAQKHRRFLKSHLPIDGLPLYDMSNTSTSLGTAVIQGVLAPSAQTFTETHREQLSKIGVEDPVIGSPYPLIPEEPAAFSGCG